MNICWILVIIAALIVEGITTQLVSIWFAVGGIAGIIANAFGMPPWQQFLLAAVVSLIVLIVTRPFAKKFLHVRETYTNADRCIGEKALVLQTINNKDEIGQVRVNGSVWAARSENDDILEKGTTVTVKRIEGVKLIVS